MMRKTFEISVIVPTYNRSEQLEYTIKSLLKQSIDPALFELVVADDGSSDDTQAVIKKYENQLNIKYAYQKDDGYKVSAARNLGIKLADGKLCLFIDSGIVLKSDCLQQHISYHQQHFDEVALIGYTYGYIHRNEVESELTDLIDPEDVDYSINQLKQRNKFVDLRAGIYERYGHQLEGMDLPWTIFWGGHLSIRRTTFSKVGLWDEGYDGNWGCEDNDLGFRIFASGCPIHVHQDAAVLHLPHSTSEDQKKKEGYANCLYFHKKFNTPETQLFLDLYLKEISEQSAEKGAIDFNAILKQAKVAS